MTASPCRDPLPLEELVAYGLGELEEGREEAFEEHYFACAHCAARLEGMHALGAEVARLVREGRLSAPITAPMLRRARDGGLAIRQYSLGPGERVPCTALPEDDVVVIHLEADLRPRSSVAMRVETQDLERGGRSVRDVESVPVDAETGNVYLLFSGALVRTYPKSRWTMRLDPDGEPSRAALGEFTLEHTPWQQLPG